MHFLEFMQIYNIFSLWLFKLCKVLLCLSSTSISPFEDFAFFSLIEIEIKKNQGVICPCICYGSNGEIAVTRKIYQTLDL